MLYIFFFVTPISMKLRESPLHCICNTHSRKFPLTPPFFFWGGVCLVLFRDLWGPLFLCLLLAVLLSIDESGLPTDKQVPPPPPPRPSPLPAFTCIDTCAYVCVCCMCCACVVCSCVYMCVRMCVCVCVLVECSFECLFHECVVVSRAFRLFVCTSVPTR